MVEATQTSAQARPRDEQGRFVAYKTETLLTKNFDKFSAVLSSVDRHVSSISSMGQTILNSMSEEAERRKTQAQLDSVKMGQNSDAMDSLIKAIKQLDDSVSSASGGKSGGGSDSVNPDKVSSNAFWGSILGAASGALTKSSIAKFGLAAAAAPFINRFVNDFITKSAENLGVSPGLAATFGESAGLASAGALIGRAFGKRMGFITATGAAAFGLGDEIAAAMGIDPESTITAFGQTIEAQNLIGGVAAGMATAASVAMSSPGVWKTAATAGVTALQFAGKFGLIGMAAAAGIYGLYSEYGDDAKAILEEYGLGKRTSEFVVDGISYASMGAALGSRFGAPGIIAGALIGLSVGLAKALFNWIKDRRVKMEEDIKKESENWMNTQEDIIDYGTPEEAGAAAHSVMNQGSLKPSPHDQTLTEEQKEKRVQQQAKAGAVVVQEATMKKNLTVVELADAITGAIASDPSIRAAGEKIGEAQRNRDGHALRASMVNFVNTLRKENIFANASIPDLFDAISMATDRTQSGAVLTQTPWSESFRMVPGREAEDFMKMFGPSAASQPADEGTLNKVSAIDEAQMKGSGGGAYIDARTTNTSVVGGQNSSTSVNTSNIIGSPSSIASGVAANVAAF